MSNRIERLRLGAAGASFALADLSAKDLAANLSDEQKAALSAELGTGGAAGSPSGAADQPEAGGDDGEKDGKEGKAGKKKDMPMDGDEEGGCAADASHVQYGHGFAAATARMAAVFASEHYEGREAVANELLVSDSALSAESIGKVLAKTPKGGDVSAELLGAIRGSNPSLGTGGGQGDGGASASDDNHGWGKASAKAAKLYGGAKRR